MEKGRFLDKSELCFEFDGSNYYNHFLSLFIQNELIMNSASRIYKRFKCHRHLADPFLKYCFSISKSLCK
jgi:hypothetical protein